MGRRRPRHPPVGAARDGQDHFRGRVAAHLRCPPRARLDGPLAGMGHLGDMRCVSPSTRRAGTRRRSSSWTRSTLSGTRRNSAITMSSTAPRSWPRCSNASMVRKAAKALSSSGPATSRQARRRTRPCRPPRQARPHSFARPGEPERHLALAPTGLFPDADLSDLAARTDGRNGASLEQLVRQGRRWARRQRRGLALDDLVAELPAQVTLPDTLFAQGALSAAEVREPDGATTSTEARRR